MIFFTLPNTMKFHLISCYLCLKMLNILPVNPFLSFLHPCHPCPHPFSPLLTFNFLSFIPLISLTLPCICVLINHLLIYPSYFFLSSIFYPFPLLQTCDSQGVFQPARCDVSAAVRERERRGEAVPGPPAPSTPALEAPSLLAASWEVRWRKCHL